MSNTFNARPITLTAVMSHGYQTTIGSVAGNRTPINPSMIIWHAPVTAGDTFSIIDPITSAVLFSGTCVTGGVDQTFFLAGRWADWQLSQISSGSLALYEGALSGLAGVEELANKDTANGYAPLDSTARLPVANLPTTVVQSGADIDASNHVTVTHLAAALPVNQGGTGVTTGTANKVFATPDGSSGAPSLRLLVSGDIPNNAANTTGSAALLSAVSALPSGTTATTQVASNSSTKVATTAFVIGQASSTTPVMDGTAAVGTSTTFARADHVHPTDTSKESLANKGIASGYAPLDSSGLLPVANLPVSAVLSGTDINTSNQVTATHLASPLPASQGGTGRSSTATYPASGTVAVVPLSGVSTNVGGSAMTAGQTVTINVSITGATTGMVVAVSPTVYPGDGFCWDGYVSASNTVTVRLTAALASTPTASAFNVRVIQ